MKKSDFSKIVTFDNAGHAPCGLYTLYQIFSAEKGNSFDITLSSVEDYVRGLPSCLSFPFWNDDILEKTGMSPKAYWRRLARYVMDLIIDSKASMVGTVSNVERVDTSYVGNPRFRFILDIGCRLVVLQTEPNSSLCYSIQNYEGKKVIVTTRLLRGKLCATSCENV